MAPRVPKALIKTVAAAFGRLGGQTITDAKSAAARRNGKKGGRPRKDGSPARSRRAR